MMTENRRGFRFMDGGSLDGPDIDVIDMMMEQGLKPRPPKEKTIIEDGTESPETTAEAEALKDREILESCGAAVGMAMGSCKFGSVYACSLDGEPGQLAIKVGRGTSGEKAGKEFQAWPELRHPHLVRLVKVVCETPLCVAYEMCLGGTLHNLLRASSHGSKLTARQRLRAAMEVASATAYVHAQGVVHRDIHPDNVFFSQPVAADGPGVKMPPAMLGYLGLAYFSEAGGPAASRRTGSVRYMAPEVISESPHGAPADVFACAVLAYEVCSGAVPYGERAGDQQVFLKVAAGVRPSLTVLQSFGGGPELATHLARAWNQDPTQRMAAAELEGTLSGLLASLP